MIEQNPVAPNAGRPPLCKDRVPPDISSSLREYLDALA